VFKKLIFVALFPCILFAQDKNNEAIRFAGYITAEGMSKNLHILTSDEYEGRETGKKGQRMAAAFISEKFKEAGIPPYVTDTYYQEFPINVIKPMPAEVKLNDKSYEGNKDYYSYPGQSEQRIDVSKVQFLGYGIDDKNYNDYTGVAVKDKVLMILSDEPCTKDSVSLVTGTKTPSAWTTNYRLKLEKAKEKGARALLVVVDDVAKDVQTNKHRLETESMKLEVDNTEMPILYISREMANVILKNQKAESIEQKIASSHKPINKLEKAKLVIDIKNRVEKINSENVLAFIEGSDRKDEVVVITAHYDHLGKNGTKIFSGADDDGSGTVAVIELAKAFAQAKQQGHGPRRSILLMTVAGEEKGLLGSSYYVQHPVYALKNTVCDLNMDMIGRQDEKHKDNPDYIYLIGSDKLSSQLHAISEKSNKLYENLDLDYTYNDVNDKNRFYYRSDHYNFAKNGIPVIFYFNGVHADYHKDTDKVEKINFNKMEKIARLVFYTAWEVANRNDRIAVDSDKN
jgi:Peptidase family M28